MHRSGHKATLLGALCAALVCLLAAAPAAGAQSLVPKGKQIYFGVNDTGDPADFGQFTAALGKHPALIQTFRSWGATFPKSIERWQTARARPILHITTADNNSGAELITPRSIAAGAGDGYLIRLNKLFWRKRMPAYIRPLGEPNRCRNVYSSYDCEGGLRSAAHAPRWYKRAFRRIHIVVHGGGKRRQINRELRQAGLPPLRSRLRGLPKAPVETIWSPLPAGSPTLPQNRPRHFYPGSRWTDWAGTDLYSDNQDWKALTGLYKRFSGKPFAIPEFGVSTGDDAAFVRKTLTWMRKRPRAKMLVYYQDFGTASAYRIQNWPAALTALSVGLRSPRFPSFAPRFPKAPPPPPGGLAPK